MFVITYNYERVIRMKFLKENKGAIIFYLVIIISTLVIVNDVKQDKKIGENKYVMTYLEK